MLGFLGKIFGTAAAEPIKAVGNVLNELFTSDDERLSKEVILQRLAQQPQMVQAEINKVSAAHRSLFVAGARPAILWICAAGLANVLLLNPWIQWITGQVGPNIDGKLIFELIGGLTGILATVRTVEKLANKTK